MEGTTRNAWRTKLRNQKQLLRGEHQKIGKNNRKWSTHIVQYFRKKNNQYNLYEINIYYVC
jgi:hypothetical protein